MNTKAKSIFALLITILSWGLAFPLVSNLMKSGMEVASLNFFRFGMALLAMLPFFVKDLKRASKSDIISSLICGVLLFGGFFFLTIALGQTESSPGLSALIVGMGIFVTPILSFVVFHKKPKKLAILGIILAFVGIFFFSYTGSLQFEFSTGIAYSFVSALLFGIHIFVLSTFMKKGNVKIISFLQIAVVFVSFAGFVFVFNANALAFQFDLLSALQLVYLAVFATGLAYFFQTYASKHLSANTCNILLGLESTAAVICSVLLGMDSVTIYYAVGAVFVLSGTLMVIVQENKES